MNANQLMIGNWVSRLGYYKQIKSIEKGCGEIDYVGVGEVFTSNQIDPIPLTEEWLEKFGFVKHSGGYLSKDSVIELTFDFLVWKPNIKRLKVLYVHQLQNLYFAITGEELTV